MKTGLTQEAFAHRLGFSQSYVAEIEKGKAEPSKNILVALLSEYSIDIKWLLTGKGEMFLDEKDLAEIFMSVGPRLEMYKQTKKLSDESMATLLNISTKEYKKIASGKKAPSAEALSSFILKTGVDPAWLVGGPMGMLMVTEKISPSDPITKEVASLMTKLTDESRRDILRAVSLMVKLPDKTRKEILRIVKKEVLLRELVAYKKGEDGKVEE